MNDDTKKDSEKLLKKRLTFKTINSLDYCARHDITYPYGEG